MKFAVWVWVSNLLTNLFSIIDRYMLVHWSGFDAAHSLELVGNYHCANIVPLLLVSIAQLLVGAVTPYLSYAWEAGKRDEVSQRLNFTLKLTSLGMTLAGVAVLGWCPMLFRIAFDNKYEAGLAALPWAVASCVWFGLLLVSQTYVWCAEKTRLAAVPLMVGLLFNTLLNVYAVPNYGLLGAVVATGIATWLSLAVQLVVNCKSDGACTRGMILASPRRFYLPGGSGLGSLGRTARGDLRRGAFFSEPDHAAGTRAHRRSFCRFAVVHFQIIKPKCGHPPIRDKLFTCKQFPPAACALTTNPRKLFQLNNSRQGNSRSTKH